MNALQRGAHGLVLAFAHLFHYLFESASLVEELLRALLDQAGIGRDVQTLLLMMMLGSAMYVALRLLRGLLRSGAAVLLLVLLFQLMSQMAGSLAGE